MKKTRNLLTLKTFSDDLIPKVLPELQFKGLVVQDSNVITADDIEQAFSNNKSILCYNIPKSLEEKYTAIPILVCAGNSFNYTNCIDINKKNIPSQFKEIAENINCDIGDHKSNSSGATNLSNVDDCSYCKLLHGYDMFNPRVIYSSKNFFVLPTLGQFIPGYLLIIPKEHIMSIAELDSSYMNEFLDVLDDVSYILNLTYHTSHLLIWENGTGNSGIGKAKDSVVHAHVHIAPSNLNAALIKKISGFDFETITTEQLANFGNESYLLIKDKPKDKWIINNNPNLYIPRQYIRQILAEEYCIPGDKWNWRTHHFADLMKKTSYDIFNTLVKYWDILPKRIKDNTKDLF